MLNENDVCSVCGSKEDLQGHHLSYDPEITVKLCTGCHTKVHKRGTGRGVTYREKSVFDPTISKGLIHPNGQVTIPKVNRDELGIKTGDLIYMKIFKVISSNGDTKFEIKEKEEK